MRRLLVSSVAVLALMAGVSAAAAQDPHAGHAGHAAPAAAQSEDARLAAFFEQAFQERIALSPQQMTSLGIKTDYDRLDDNTDGKPFANSSGPKSPSGDAGALASLKSTAYANRLAGIQDI